MGPRTNREVLKEAVRNFDIEYDYGRIDTEGLETLGELADDFMREQDNLEAAVDHLTDAEIDRLIAEERGAS